MDFNKKKDDKESKPVDKLTFVKEELLRGFNQGLSLEAFISYFRLEKPNNL